MAPPKVTDLSADELGHVLRYLPDAVDIAKVASTCHAFKVASLRAADARAAASPVPLPRLITTVHEVEPKLRALRWAEEMGRRPPRTIACGWAHTLCVSPKDGVLYTFGGDGVPEEGSEFSMLGLGEIQRPVLMPQALPLERTRSMAGWYHVMAVDDSGSAWSWGYGDDGRHGLGDESHRFRPERLPSLSGILQVSCGNGHSLLLTANGGVLVCGSVLGGLDHSQDRLNPSLRPSPVAGFAGRRVVEVSSGESQCTAVDEEGGLWTWGYGGIGQLGHGDTEMRREPKKVQALASVRIRHALAASDHTQAVSVTGVLYSWGHPCYNGLGQDDCTALPVRNPTLAGVPVRQLAGNFEGHCVALTEAGEVYTWGTGSYGALGHGDREDKPLPTLVTTLLPPLTSEQRLLIREAGGKIEQLAPVINKLRSQFAGPAVIARFHSLAAACGDVFEALGHINDGFGAGHLSSPVVEVAAGVCHTVARLADGRIFTWGEGAHGALGHGGTDNQLAPKQIDMGVLLPPRA